MKKIFATGLIAAGLLAGMVSVASASYLDGFPQWAQAAFSPRGI